LEQARLLQQLPAVITAAAQQLADLQDNPAVAEAALLGQINPIHPAPQEEVKLFFVHSHLQQLLLVLQLV
jgi:hypothetical protein